MSLVIAQKSEGRIHIVGDTLLTNAESYAPLPHLQGIVKSVLLSEQVCLSFAGNPFYADKAIQALCETSLLPHDLSLIKDVLLKIHQESKNSTDFILATASFENRISRISAGECVDSDVCWIGSEPGFRTFQSSRASERTSLTRVNESAEIPANPSTDKLSNSQEILVRMNSAMQFVIDDQSIGEVGGFVVSISTINGKFEYMLYMSSVNYRVDLTSVAGDWRPIPFGSAADGGYAMEFGSGTLSGNPIPFFYLLQGGFGVVYLRRNGGWPKPEIVRAQTPAEFELHLSDDYGIAARSVYCQPVQFEALSNKYASDGDRDTAMRIAEFVIARNPTDASGFRARGVRRTEVGDHEGSLEDFIVALRLNEEDARNWFNVGLLMGMMGRPREAIDYLQQALQIDPHHEGAAKYLQLAQKELNPTK